ncbi:MAG: protein translocase subunit SecF [Pseudomonadota bacterium]
MADSSPQARRKVPFMRYRLIALAFSVLALIAAIVLVAGRGLNFGIDFVGGSVIEIATPEGAAVEDVRATVGGLGLGEVQVTEAFGTGADPIDVMVIRVQTQDAEEGEEEAAQGAAKTTVIEALRADYPNLDVRSQSTIGPKVSGELLTSGVTSLAIALALMLAYIWFRFDRQYPLGAVAALAHDVILTLGVFAALQLEFNLSTIAALLTIIGYSMNDTVVVFDRIREERPKYKKMSDSDVIDLALNGTLTRTLLTSGTTLIALLAIFILGGPVLRGMSFALIWGVIIGTYSSIFVASSLLLVFGLRPDKKPTETPGFQGAP